MNSKVLKRLLSYFGNYRGRVAAAIVSALAGSVFTILAPKILGEITTILYAGVSDGYWMVEELSDGTANPDSVWKWVSGVPVGKVGAIIFIAIILTIMYLLSLFFCSMANKLLAKLASYVVRDLRSDIDKKMHRMKLDYYDSHTNGEVLSVITNDVDAVNTLLGKNIYTVITQGIALVGVLIMLFTINVWLALIAILMIPGTLLLTRSVQRKSAKFYSGQQNLLGKVNGYVEETYGGQTVVTSFNYQNRAMQRFDEMNEDLKETARQAARYAGLVMPLTQMVIYVGYGLEAMIGCIFAMKGYMTVGNVQSALQYVNHLQQPFTTISQMSGQLASAIAAGERIFSLLDAEEEIPDPAEGRVPEECNGSVEFRHVQFGYTPEHLLMTDVNVKAAPGKKFAIVGPTGAGKTTLINLLMRFYEINSGEIRVDGVNTQEMTRHELRTHFGMVLQDTWLFQGTIRDNLKYGAGREVSDEEMIEAAKSVCADSFIRTMPGGYDMMLSKGAENISQGQRQLLTIARAIIANPEIMILDEATSNVDAHTEQVIQDAMATLMEGRTSFVIAHRLSTIRDAHAILYMENGDIKEIGNHDTLMALDGKYAALYNSQFA